MEYKKYPRTPHMPWSLSKTDDDKTLLSDEYFYTLDEIIITEKMDGENTTIYGDGYCHARSIDTAHKGYHSYLLNKIVWKIAPYIPEGWRVCGEYMYAQHSIHYDNLEDYFYIFGMFGNVLCAS